MGNKGYETANATRMEAIKAQYRAIYACLLKLTKDEIYRHGLESKWVLGEHLPAGDIPVLETGSDDLELGTVVLGEEQEPGVWLVRTASVIPDNERWLHEPKAAADLAPALNWSRSNAASDDSADVANRKLTDAA